MTSMKVTVLGRWGPYPARGGACSGYLVECGETKIVLDLGNGTLSRLQEYCGLDEVDCLVLSHLHPDHSADALVLRYALALGGERQTLHCLVPPEPEGLVGDLNYEDAYEIESAVEGVTYRVGEVQVDFIRNRHMLPCVATRLEYKGVSLVYTADTGYYADLAGFAGGADLLIAEANLLEEHVCHVQGHMSGGQAAKVASEAGVDHLLLTHIFPEFDPNQVLSEANALFPRCELAAEGRRYEIGLAR